MSVTGFVLFASVVVFGVSSATFFVLVAAFLVVVLFVVAMNLMSTED